MWESLGIICGLLCVLSVVALVAFVIIFNRKQAALFARIEEEGVTLKSWIVMANSVLYDADDTTSYSYAVVVFSPDPKLNDEEALMADWIAAIGDYEPPENPKENERIIGSVMRTQVPYFQPLRLPKQIAGRDEGYMISIRVQRSLLPEGAITLPYIYIKVLIEEKGEANMAPYPRRNRDE